MDFPGVVLNMGYSIGIRTRSPRLKKAMVDLMAAEYRNWPKLSTGKDGPVYASAPTDDLSYDHAKTAIGIDYGACFGWEREYAHTLVRWMALRAGTNRSQFSEGIRIPFWVYDGYEASPILVCSKSAAKRLPKHLQQYAVDNLGIHIGPLSAGEWAGYSMFEPGYPKGAQQRAEAKAGPYPEKGDRHAWRDRFNLALLEEPFIRANVDKGIDLIRTELERLDALWEACS